MTVIFMPTISLTGLLNSKVNLGSDFSFHLLAATKGLVDMKELILTFIEEVLRHKDDSRVVIILLLRKICNSN